MRGKGGTKEVFTRDWDIIDLGYIRNLGKYGC
jgi:hypothetical protein